MESAAAESSALGMNLANVGIQCLFKQIILICVCYWIFRNFIMKFDTQMIWSAICNKIS